MRHIFAVIRTRIRSSLMQQITVLFTNAFLVSSRYINAVYLIGGRSCNRCFDS